jgi:hypothetical protein
MTGRRRGRESGPRRSTSPETGGGRVGGDGGGEEREPSNLFALPQLTNVCYPLEAGDGRFVASLALPRALAKICSECVN